MPHIETLRARLRGLADELIKERQRAARGEVNSDMLAAAERRFNAGMGDVGADELLAMLGDDITQGANDAA